MYAQPEPRTPRRQRHHRRACRGRGRSEWYYWNEYEGIYDYEDLTWYDYYLVRGFAVVECGGLGTRGSDGFETCGSDLEIDAFKCVIEWALRRPRGLYRPGQQHNHRSRLVQRQRRHDRPLLRRHHPVRPRHHGRPRASRPSSPSPASQAGTSTPTPRASTCAPTRPTPTPWPPTARAATSIPTTTPP